MTVKTYDPKVYDLAEHFVLDDPKMFVSDYRDHRIHDLAIEIQTAIEEWFKIENAFRTKGT